MLHKDNENHIIPAAKHTLALYPITTTFDHNPGRHDSLASGDVAVLAGSAATKGGPVAPARNHRKSEAAACRRAD
jgi:hypothetical protein